MEPVDAGTISTVASIIAGFGAAMLLFRIERELEMRKQDEVVWIPWADRLLIVATLTSLLMALLPLVALRGSVFAMRVGTAACAASITLVAGYVLAILAHYRLLWGRRREGPRENPEPAERNIVYVSVAAALACAACVLR